MAEVGILVAAMSLLFAGVSSLDARTNYWSNNAGGDFTNAANWGGGMVPGAADDAAFTNPASYQVNWTMNVTNANALFFTNAGTFNGTVTQNLGSATWWITNDYRVGAGAVVQTGGVLAHTNESGSGLFLVGAQNGASYTLAQGVLLTTRAMISNSFSTVTIRGTSSVWTNSSTLNIGVTTLTPSSTNNLLLITNGGVVVNQGIVTVGYGTSIYPAFSNALVVTGNDSTLVTPTNLVVGDTTARFNSLWIMNTAAVYNSVGKIGTTAASYSNFVVVTSGGFWSNAALSINGSGVGSQLFITNGGHVLSGSATYGAGGKSSSVWVMDPGSTWTNTGGLWVGNSSGSSGISNSLIVGKQGLLVVGDLLAVGYGNNTANALMNIFEGGQVFSSIGGIGSNGPSNDVAVASGGFWSNATSIKLGNTAPSFANRLLVTNGGRVMTGSLQVGVASGTNAAWILEGGLLEATNLTVGSLANNAISNIGGVYQFVTATPTIAIAGGNTIALSNGWIAFRGVANADVMGSLGSNQTGNIRYSGENRFRLDNAANTGAASPQDYSFASGISPSNYVGLELINGSTAWRSARLNVGNGGGLLISNTAATVGGTLTNAGTIRVVNATATWQSNVTLIGGSFTLKDATNTFASALQIESGALLGGSGRIVNSAAVTNRGSISPGNSPGTLTFSSDLILLGSSILQLEIAGTNWADYDHLVVDGRLAKGGAISVTNLGWTFAEGDTFDFWTAASVDGSFLSTNSWVLPTLDGGLFWDTHLFESEGILSVAAIPEPRALLALGAGLSFLALFRRRRRA